MITSHAVRPCRGLTTRRLILQRNADGCELREAATAFMDGGDATWSIVPINARANARGWDAHKDHPSPMPASSLALRAWHRPSSGDCCWHRFARQVKRHRWSPSKARSRIVEAPEPAMQNPRVALIGLALESNRWSRPASEEDFRSVCWLEGDEILKEARSVTPAMPMEAAAFVKAMDATGPWQPLPILIASSFPAGPIEQATFERVLTFMLAGLKAALPLAAVYICNHGAMTATHTFDPDGEIVRGVREIVGSKPRLVMTLDLHANISEQMVTGCDLVVGYRTNPHVDMIERGEEVAFGLRRMLAGSMDAKTALVRLPLTPASVNLLTNTGPYGELIDYGQKRQAE